MRRRRPLLAAVLALALAAGSWAVLRAVLRYAEATDWTLGAYPAFGDDEGDGCG